MKEKVGKKIKLLRKHYGYTQEEIAKKLNISRSAFERMENGSSSTWACHLKNLSHIFGVPPEYFVQPEHSQQKNPANEAMIRPNKLPDELLEEFLKYMQEK